MLDPAPSAVSPAIANTFASWSPPIPLTVLIALLALIYLRGVVLIRRTRSALFTDLRLASFFAGAVLLWIAVASPMDSFADALLSIHMVEHLLLMCAIPPLLLYGLPVVPLLRGVPAPLRRGILGPLLRRRWLRRLVHWLVIPRVAFLAMNFGYLIWHVPALYDLGLENEGWHAVEHLSFLVPSLLFWYTILWTLAGAATEPALERYLVPARFGRHHDRALRISYLLRPRRVPLLLGTSESLRHFRAQRSGARRGHDVGAWIVRLSHTRDIDYVPAALAAKNH